jgi:uncharacterized protein (TIGR02246 family)
MKVRPWLIIILLTMGALYALYTMVRPIGTLQPKTTVSLRTRLRMLEDREEIRRLMINYGRTLDQRNFSAFAKLFAKDAEYGSGAGGGTTKGAEAIAKLLEDIIRKNPTGLNTPNYHLFCNETIELHGDLATASSKGIFVVRSDKNKPESVMLAAYNDTFLRENDGWKFKQRIVHSDIPPVK